VLQVAFNFNTHKQCAKTGKAPVRYTMVVTGEPDAPQLSEEQRQAVQLLLDNSDGKHKVLVGASLKQARHFVQALYWELRPSESPYLW
jgi:hypothetical protein